jgi:hypothetical protein
VITTTRHLLTAMLVTAFALSACGSDDPVDTDRGDTESSDTESSDTESSDTESSDTESSDTESSDTESSDTESAAPSQGGTVTVDGVAYTFGAEVCFFQGSDFLVAGPGSDPGGDVGHVYVEGSSETDFDLDGQPDESIMITVEVGAAQMGSGTEDQPYFTVSASGDALAEQVTFERSNNSVSGSGFMVDNNTVAAEFNEPIPFEFEVSCG